MVRTFSFLSLSCLFSFVSIPSRRGNGSDTTYKRRCQMNILSQSPQGGAMVRTNEFIASVIVGCKVSIPSRRGNGSDSFGIKAVNLLHQVSIPSRRGNGSDPKHLPLKSHGYLSLNPLKAGQWFGQMMKKTGVAMAVRLNPLKAGQWFGLSPVVVGRGRTDGLNPLKAGQWFGPFSAPKRKRP